MTTKVMTYEQQRAKVELEAALDFVDLEVKRENWGMVEVYTRMVTQRAATLKEVQR